MRTYLINLYRNGESFQERITCLEEDLNECINNFRDDGYEIGNVIQIG